jgi:hypothetical protein
MGAADRRHTQADPGPGRGLPPRLGLLVRPRRGRAGISAARPLEQGLAENGGPAAEGDVARGVDAGGELARKVVHMGVGSSPSSLRSSGRSGRRCWPRALWRSTSPPAAHRRPQALARARGRRRLVDRRRALPAHRDAPDPGLLEAARGGGGDMGHPRLRRRHGLDRRHDPGPEKLPWNPKKSWAGTLGYWLFGTAAAAALLVWTAPGRYGWAFALACGAAAALLAALLESLPQGLDDNLGVPMVTGLFLLGLVLGAHGWAALAADPEFHRRLLIGAGVNLLLAAAGFGRTDGRTSRARSRASSSAPRSGPFLDWRGYLLLLAFFVLGSACDQARLPAQGGENLAQEGGGRRGARHAFANCGVRSPAPRSPPPRRTRWSSRSLSPAPSPPPPPTPPVARSASSGAGGRS